MSVAAVVLGWNLTNEIYAAYGRARPLASGSLAAFVRPPDWVDRAVGDGSVVVVGQQFGTDTNDVHLLEFWNRSIDKVWSVDPSSPAPGPGPIADARPVEQRRDAAPDSRDGLCARGQRGVALQAPVIATAKPGQTLYRLDGKPLKIAFTQTGVYSDGWMSTRPPTTASTSRRPGRAGSRS